MSLDSILAQELAKLKAGQGRPIRGANPLGKALASPSDKAMMESGDTAIAKRSGKLKTDTYNPTSVSAKRATQKGTLEYAMQVFDRLHPSADQDTRSAALSYVWARSGGDPDKVSPSIAATAAKLAKSNPQELFRVGDAYRTERSQRAYDETPNVDPVTGAFIRPPAPRQISGPNATDVPNDEAAASYARSNPAEYSGAPDMRPPVPAAVSDSIKWLSEGLLGKEVGGAVAPLVDPVSQVDFVGKQIPEMAKLAMTPEGRSQLASMAKESLLSWADPNAPLESRISSGINLSLALIGAPHLLKTIKGAPAALREASALLSESPDVSTSALGKQAQALLKGGAGYSKAPLGFDIQGSIDAALKSGDATTVSLARNVAAKEAAKNFGLSEKSARDMVDVTIRDTMKRMGMNDRTIIADAGVTPDTPSEIAAKAEAEKVAKQAAKEAKATVARPKAAAKPKKTSTETPVVATPKQEVKPVGQEKQAKANGQGRQKGLLSSNDSSTPAVETVARKTAAGTTQEAPTLSVGAKVSHPEYGEGEIVSKQPNGMLEMAIGGDKSNTAIVPKKELSLLGEAGNRAQKQAPEPVAGGAKVSPDSGETNPASQPSTSDFKPNGEWYAPYVKPRGFDRRSYSVGTKVGAARALGLPDNSFMGLTYDEFGKFFQDWKKHTGEDHLPHSDAYNLNLNAPSEPKAPQTPQTPKAAESAAPDVSSDVAGNVAQKEPWQMTADEAKGIIPTALSDAEAYAKGHSLPAEQWTTELKPSIEKAQKEYDAARKEWDRAQMPSERQQRRLKDAEAKLKDLKERGAKAQADNRANDDFLKKKEADYLLAHHPDLFVARDSWPFYVGSERYSQLHWHKDSVKKALSEGKPVPPEVLADYPDLAAKYEKTTSPSDKEPWRLFSSEGYAHQMGAPKPHITLGDLSGEQMQRMSERARREYAKTKTEANITARKAHEEAVAKWKSELWDAYKDGRFTVEDAFKSYNEHNTDAFYELGDRFHEIGVEFKSPFKISTMEPEARSAYLADAEKRAREILAEPKPQPTKEVGASHGEFMPTSNSYVGQKFYHSRVIDPETKAPAEYVVTKIAKGNVYYKPIGGGKSEYIAQGRFDSIARVKRPAAKSPLAPPTSDTHATVPAKDLFTSDPVTGHIEFSPQAGDWQILEFGKKAEQNSIEYSKKDSPNIAARHQALAYAAKRELERRKSLREYQPTKEVKPNGQEVKTEAPTEPPATHPAKEVVTRSPKSINEAKDIFGHDSDEYLAWLKAQQSKRPGVKPGSKQRGAVSPVTKDDVRIAYEIGAVYVRRGVKSVTEFVAKMASEVGDWVRPHAARMFTEISKGNDLDKMSQKTFNALSHKIENPAHADTAALRDELGYDAYDAKPETVKQWKAKAAQLNGRELQIAQDAIDDKKRALVPAEEIALGKRLNKFVEEMDKAQASGDHGAWQFAHDSAETIMQALDKKGSEAARGLRARQEFVKASRTPWAQTQRAKAAKGGELTTRERIPIENGAKAEADIAAQSEKATAELKKMRAESALDAPARERAARRGDIQARRAAAAKTIKTELQRLLAGPAGMILGVGGGGAGADLSALRRAFMEYAKTLVEEAPMALGDVVSRITKDFKLEKTQFDADFLIDSIANEGSRMSMSEAAKNRARLTMEARKAAEDIATNATMRTKLGKQYDKVVKRIAVLEEKVKAGGSAPVKKTPEAVPDALKELVAKRDELQKKLDDLNKAKRPPSGGVTEKGLREAINRLTSRIESGDYSRKPKGKPQVPPELIDLYDQKKFLEKELNRRRAAATAAQRRVENLKKSISDLESSLKDGGFRPPTKRERAKSAEITNLEIKLARLKKENDLRIMALKPTHWTERVETIFSGLQLSNPMARIKDLAGNTGKLVQESAIMSHARYGYQAAMKKLVADPDFTPRGINPIRKGQLDLFDEPFWSHVKEETKGAFQGIDVDAQKKFGSGTIFHGAAGATDVPFRELYRRAYLRDWAYGNAQMAMPGVSPKDPQFMEMVRESIRNAPETVVRDSHDWSAHMTYNAENIASVWRAAIDRGLKQFRDKEASKGRVITPIGYDMVRALNNATMRFGKVIYNVGVNKARMSPAGLIEGGMKWALAAAKSRKGVKMTTYDARMLSDILARGTIGTAGWALGYYLKKAGVDLPWAGREMVGIKTTPDGQIDYKNDGTPARTSTKFIDQGAVGEISSNLDAAILLGWATAYYAEDHTVKQQSKNVPDLAGAYTKAVMEHMINQPMFGQADLLADVNQNGVASAAANFLVNKFANLGFIAEAARRSDAIKEYGAARGMVYDRPVKVEKKQALGRLAGAVQSKIPVKRGELPTSAIPERW